MNLQNTPEYRKRADDESLPAKYLKRARKGHAEKRFTAVTVTGVFSRVPSARRKGKARFGGDTLSPTVRTENLSFPPVGY